MPGKPVTTVFATRTGLSGWLSGVLLLVVLAVAGCRENQARELPAHGTVLATTTVSGLSSGAYMAGQFQIARSSIVKGAAIIAGGPYGCAESTFADVMPGPGTAFLNLSKAMNGCMRNALAMMGMPDPKQLAERVRALAVAQRIDPIASILDDRVYLFSGRNDTTVVEPIVAAARDLYLALGLPPNHLHYVATLPAGHGFVVEASDLVCGATDPPYIIDCDYDQAGELLRHLYAQLSPPSPKPAGVLAAFDQRPFLAGLPDHGLDDTGFVYVPESCRSSAGCGVHVAFHGCNQSRSQIDKVFAERTGFARWADTNRLVLLFPQVEPSPINPKACWDWWGYTGRDYLTRSAPQVIAVTRMLERLAGRPSI